MKQKSWISIVFSFASQCRGKIVLSVLCAIISVVAGLIPYWSVYQIITLFIGGSPVMAEVWKWCWIGLGAYAIRFLLYGISTSLSHISAYCNDIAVTHSEFGYSKERLSPAFL